MHRNPSSKRRSNGKFPIGGEQMRMRRSDLFSIALKAAMNIPMALL